MIAALATVLSLLGSPDFTASTISSSSSLVSRAESGNGVATSAVANVGRVRVNLGLGLGLGFGVEAAGATTRRKTTSKKPALQKKTTSKRKKTTTRKRNAVKKTTSKKPLKKKTTSKKLVKKSTTRKKKTTTRRKNTSTKKPRTTSTKAPSSPYQTHILSLPPNGYKFTPQNVTISLNDTVTFVIPPQQIFAHNVQEYQADRYCLRAATPRFDSGQMQSQSEMRYSVKFEGPKYKAGEVVW